MNAASVASGWALAFAAGCSVLCAQIGHAQANLPPVTAIQPQPTKLVAADNCCPSGLAQMVLTVLPPNTRTVRYGTDLARTWNDLRLEQQAVIRAKLGIPWVPLLNSVNPTTPFRRRSRLCDVVPGWISPTRSCRSALSISADPQSKLLKVSFRVYDNKLVRAPSSASNPCGTFGLELAMDFEVTSDVTLRSSEVRTSNFVSTGACDRLGIERISINDVFVDAGIATKLAEQLTSSLRRVAGDHGAVTPGVRPEDRKSLVFEITPSEGEVPVVQ